MQELLDCLVYKHTVGWYRQIDICINRASDIRKNEAEWRCGKLIRSVLQPRFGSRLTAMNGYTGTFTLICIIGCRMMRGSPDAAAGVVVVESVLEVVPGELQGRGGGHVSHEALKLDG